MIIDEIATKLQTDGVGTVGTDIFKGKLPDTPNNVILVSETGGIEPDPELPTNSPTFQVYVRNTSYANANAKIQAVRASLHQSTNETFVVGQHYFYYVFALSEPLYIGEDDKGRKEFTINFRCKTR